MVELVNPASHQPLRLDDKAYRDAAGNAFPFVGGIGRFCEIDNYASSFGTQWNIFRETQIDRPNDGLDASATRLFRETGWSPEDLADLDILEVGSGAGRFSRAILERTKANLYSVDYSSAVDANLANNGAIAPDRFHLFQASIYELPFPDDSFDKVVCFGVLQHTPNFEASVEALIRKAKPGGEIVVDFYPIRGFWTKINAKYMLRPFTRKMPHDRLLALVRRNVPWLLKLSLAMNRVGLHAFTRFLPVPDLRTIPQGVSPELMREWMVMDTFDMLSPEHDHPQRISAVRAMFERHGATVTFAEFVNNGSGEAPVVRGIKNHQGTQTSGLSKSSR
jgi:SAM-dependent methyltransferase